MLPRPKTSHCQLLSEELGSYLSEATSTQCQSERHFSPVVPLSSQNLSGTDNQLFQCPHCSGDFVSAKGLKQHIGKKHDPRRKYSKCPECTKKYRDKYAVRFHIKQVHEKATRVVCGACSVEFYNKYMMKKHHCSAPRN